jgi:FtsX-like permease family
MQRRRFLISSLAAFAFPRGRRVFGAPSSGNPSRNYKFQETISREVLGNYLFSFDLHGRFVQRARRPERQPPHADDARCKIQHCAQYLPVEAWAVSQYTREIGVRMALGATQSEISLFFLSRGIRATILGIMCGTAATLLLTHFLRSQPWLHTGKSMSLCNCDFGATDFCFLVATLRRLFTLPPSTPSKR